MTEPIAAIEILARVRRMHPNDAAAQRKALVRWAGLLRRHDPRVAREILDLRFAAKEPRRPC